MDIATECCVNRYADGVYCIIEIESIWTRARATQHFSLSLSPSLFLTSIQWWPVSRSDRDKYSAINSKSFRSMDIRFKFDALIASSVTTTITSRCEMWLSKDMRSVDSFSILLSQKMYLSRCVSNSSNIRHPKNERAIMIVVPTMRVCRVVRVQHTSFLI